MYLLNNSLNNPNPNFPFQRVQSRLARTNRPRGLVYVVQRNALLSPITVRFVKADDELRIRMFHEKIDHGSNHAEEVLNASKHLINYPNSMKNVYSIIFTCETSMIGVCIVEFVDKKYILDNLFFNIVYFSRTDPNLPQYRLNYEIDSYIEHSHHRQPDKCCLLRMMVLQPAFMSRLPFIVSEIFRQTGFSSMFYKLLDYSGVSSFLNTYVLKYFQLFILRTTSVYTFSCLWISSWCLV